MATGKGGKSKPEGAIAKKETKAKTKAKAKPRTQDGSPIRDYSEGPQAELWTPEIAVDAVAMPGRTMSAGPRCSGSRMFGSHGTT